MIQLVPGEKLLTAERRHWLPIALESVGLFLAAILPFFLIIGMEIFLPAEYIATVAEYRALIWFLYATWMLAIWMGFGIYFTNYYLDVLFVTNRRIIDVEQFGLFSRDIAELHLDNIEDIRVETKGLIPSLFKYGDLHLQTAGDNREFHMKNVCEPYKVQETISKARMALENFPEESPQSVPAPVRKI